jgi:hypothetical protein
MTQRNEALLWWKVALHIDEAQLSLVNAMALNVDDPRPIYALQEKIREAQAILLEIFGAKGLLPSAATRPEAPVPPPMVPPPMEPPTAPPMTPEQFSASLEQVSGAWMQPPEVPAIVVQETTEEAPPPPSMANGSSPPLEAATPNASSPVEPEA